MYRKLVAITLFVSFLAMASSGMMMFVIEKPSFTIQMHPVHKLFGLIMVIAVICHLTLNYKALLNYVKTKTPALYAGVLSVLLVVLYGVVINNQIPEEIATPMDALAAKAEGHE